jgi:hypothetical protein
MTRTDLDQLRERQRHYEWALARETSIAATTTLIAGKTHDLLNLVQIIQLATGELARRCDAQAQEFIDDLTRAATDAQASLTALMATVRPARTVVRGVPVGVALAAVVESSRAFVAIDLHLAVAPDTATACTAEDLAHLVIGLALDAASHVDLSVREREIAGKPHVEIVRGALGVADPFELGVCEAIAVRAGGELGTSEARGGGTEVIVALPVVAA